MKLKRALSMALCVLMLGSLLPASALAADEPAAVIDPVTPNGQNDWYTEARLLAPEGYEISLQEDGTKETEVTIPEGEHTGGVGYYLWADSNMTGPHTSAPVKMDKTAPSIAQPSVTPGEGNSVSISVEAMDVLSGVDKQSYQLSSGDDPEPVISSPVPGENGCTYSVSNLKWNHLYNFTVEVQDLAGNVAKKEFEVRRICEHNSFGADNKCTDCGAAAVAKVNAAFYADMDKAVAEWTKDEDTEKTLTLLQDCTYEGEISLPEAKRILELNGFEFEVSKGIRLNKTELTVQSSEEDGSIIRSEATCIEGAAIDNSVIIKENVTVKPEEETPDLYAVNVQSLRVEGDPDIGIVLYEDGYQMDLSAYSGSCMDICFNSGYSVTGGSIVLPENYGFYDAELELITADTIENMTASVMHGHRWQYSVEENVITATCVDIGTCSVTGNTASLTLKTAEDSPVYDGTAKNCILEKSHKAPFRGVTEENIVYSAAERIAAGTYTATLECGGKTAKLDYEIAPKAISGEVSFTQPGPYTYTGTAIEPGTAIDGLTEGTDYTVSYENNLNAGTARAIVTGKGNYAGTLEKEFTIQPVVIPITAKLVKDTYEYTGSAIEPEITVTTMRGETEINLEQGMDYTLDYAPKTEAGSTVTVTVKPADDGNYTFAEATLQFAIVPATPACSKPADVTATYGQKLTELSLPAGWSWDARDFTLTDLGAQSFAVTFTPDDTKNYKEVKETITVTVQPAPITITGAAVTGKTYDGSDQLSITGVTAQGIVSGDVVTVVLPQNCKGTAPSANAGSYTEITLPTLTLTGADSGNYTLVQPGKVPASYTIARKAVYPVVEVAAGTYRYNGMAQTPTVTVRDGAAVIPAEEYTVSYSSNLHVGTGYATVSDKEGGNYDLTQVTGSFTIQTTTITITADNKSATTGQKAPALTYTVTGLVAGEKLSKEPTVSYVTTPDMSKAGTTLIRAGGAVAPSSDYTISYVDGTLTVVKASSSGGSYTGSYTGNVSVTVDMSGVELVSKTYDGKPISFGGKASARYYTGNFTYTWYTASGYKLSEAPTDAGDYTLRATVNRSGYTGYASKNVTIRKAALTITADDLRANVGDAAPKLSYSVKGLGSGDKLKTEPQLSYEKEPDMTKPGEVPIIVSGAEAPDTKNYEKDIRYIEGTLTIGEAAPEEEKTPEESVETAEPMRKLEVSVGSASRELEKALDSKESAYYELALRESADGGANWTAAGSQLPEGGVQVSLPLPEGSDENCSFRVVHADGEYPATLVRKEDGKWYLEFTATELGSVAVGWTAPGKEGGFPWWLLPLLAVGGGVVGIVCNRKRRRSY